jgi:hypothetical protein
MLCSIIMQDWIEIIIVYEENWWSGDLVVHISYVWWGVMQLWKWLLTWVNLLSNKSPWDPNLAKYYTPSCIIKIHQNTDYFSNMVNTGQKNDKCFICNSILFDKNRLDNQNQQYHPIPINIGLLPNRILLPTTWDHPEPEWFHNWQTAN